MLSGCFSGDNRFLLHRMSCYCGISICLIALIHVYQMLEVLLDSVHLTHYFFEIHLCVVNPLVAVAYLIRGVTNHLPHILDFLGNFLVVHNANSYHFIQTPEIFLQVCKIDIFICLVHSTLSRIRNGKC